MFIWPNLCLTERGKCEKTERATFGGFFAQISVKLCTFPCTRSCVKSRDICRLGMRAGKVLGE